MRTSNSNSGCMYLFLLFLFLKIKKNVEMFLYGCGVKAIKVQAIQNGALPPLLLRECMVKVCEYDTRTSVATDVIGP